MPTRKVSLPARQEETIITGGDSDSKNATRLTAPAPYQPILDQFKAALVQGKAAFNFDHGYEYASQVQHSLINIFLGQEYLPYLAQLPVAELAALQKDVYEWLVMSGMEIANHFSKAVGLEVSPDLAAITNNPLTSPGLLTGEVNPYTGITTTATAALAIEADNAGEIISSISNNKRQWRRSQLETLVTQPLPGWYWLGKHNTKERLALVNHPLAVEIVKLLGHYGAMTNFQLRAILSGVEYDRGQRQMRQRNTMNTRVFEALYHLRFAGADMVLPAPVGSNSSISSVTPAPAPVPGRLIVRDVSVEDWEHGRGRQPKMWMLGEAGKLWYQMLTGAVDVPGGNSATASVLLPHTYGVQQVLAGLRALVNANNHLQTLTQLLTYLAATPTGGEGSSSNSSNVYGKDNASGKDSDSASNNATSNQLYQSGRFRMEVEAWAKSFPLSHSRTGSQGRLIPDAVGRLVVDQGSKELEQLLLAGSGLNPELAINEFAHLTRYGQIAFPFFLEFDRNTETARVFAEDKYPKYADIFNAPAASAWLPQWGTKFPVVLVVTDGASAHLLSLLKAVVQERRANKQQKPFVYWWFTTTVWFSAAYRPYLDDALAGQWERYLAQHSDSHQEDGNSGNKKLRKNGRKQVEGQPPAGHDPRCWLSLGVGAGIKLEDVEAVDRYYRAADPHSVRPALVAKMSALPLPHPLNIQPSPRV